MKKNTTRDEFYNHELIQRNEKCSKCPHPSMKCLICGKAQDNIMNEYIAEIKILRDLISKRNYTKYYVNSQMKILIQEKVRFYEVTKKDKYPCPHSVV